MNETEVDAEQAQLIAEAKVRAERARRALENAPALAEHLRRTLTPADGRTEVGVLPTDRTPLLTAVADAADELLVDLAGWAQYWAEQLATPAPTVSLWRDRDGGERGFHANTTPGQARLQVSAIASWLLWNEEDIASHEVVDEYRDGVTEIVWRLRAASGLTSPKRGAGIREKSLLECERCHELEMRVEYFGGSIAGAELRGENLAANASGIDIYCAHCGWQPEPKASSIARWLSYGNAETATPAEVQQVRVTIARPHEPLESDAWAGHEAQLLASLGSRLSAWCADVDLEWHLGCDGSARDGGRCACPFCRHGASTWHELGH